MKKQLTFFLTFAFIFFTFGKVDAFNIVNRPPPETILLKSPNYRYGNWKEIARHVSEKEGLVEYIPLDQQIANWSELIGIHYYENTFINETDRTTLEFILDHLRETMLGAYPGNKVTWRVIEKNKSDAIYEWILHKPYKDIPRNMKWLVLF